MFFIIRVCALQHSEPLTITRPNSARRKPRSRRRRQTGKVFAISLVGIGCLLKFELSAHPGVDDRERDLKRYRNAPSAEAERAQLKTQLLELAKRRLEIVRDYAVCTNPMVDLPCLTNLCRT